jgi:hypothetical protein
MKLIARTSEEHPEFPAEPAPFNRVTALLARLVRGVPGDA